MRGPDHLDHNRFLKQLLNKIGVLAVIKSSIQIQIIYVCILCYDGFSTPQLHILL